MSGALDVRAFRMSARGRQSGGARTLANGVLAGAAAWWAMDRTLQFFYDRQPVAARRRERAARGGVPALEVLAERLAGLGGLGGLGGRTLSPTARERAGTVLQWAMGIGAGVLYAALRQRLPRGGLAWGLGYGAAFSLLVDEGAVPLLGLAPGPAAFPWQTHARGFVGHLVFGGAAEAVMIALEGRERG